MGRGVQLKIYLADGSVSGVRHAEIVNWTGPALAIPRNHMKNLDKWEETHKPGIYFLFGYDVETGENSVYIGEAEDTHRRLLQHFKSKDFWNKTIFL